jgi:hypothetical protein
MEASFFAFRYSLSRSSQILLGMSDSSSITALFLPFKHTRTKGPSLHRHYPASQVLLTLSDAQMIRHPKDDVRVRDSRPSRASPTDCRLPSLHAVLTTPAARLVRLRLWFIARSRAWFFPAGSAFPALPPGRRHIVAFEACSSFTPVTACKVARPPYVDFFHEVSASPVYPDSPLDSYRI